MTTTASQDQGTAITRTVIAERIAARYLQAKGKLADYQTQSARDYWDGQRDACLYLAAELAVELPRYLTDPAG